MPYPAPSRCWLLPVWGAGAGRGLGLALLILLGWLAADVSGSYASCGHYVRDRLNPHGGHGMSERWAEAGLSQTWSIGRVPIPLAIVSGPQVPGGPMEPAWPVAPCHGPGCRAPVAPLVPSGLSTVIVSADEAPSAAVPLPVAASFVRPDRPRRPRPQSERLPAAFSHGLFKPPC